MLYLKINIRKANSHQLIVLNQVDSTTEHRNVCILLTLNLPETIDYVSKLVQIT